MALVTANGVTILSGTILMPLVGVWTADLVLDQPDGSGFDAGTEVTIASGSFSLVGTVAPKRTGDFLDAVHVRVWGGAGGMSADASPRAYVQPGAFVRDVLSGLMADAGETLSSTADASFTGTNLAAWSVIGGEPVAQALAVLLEFIAPSLSWRFLSDGTLWIGSETWPAASGTFDLIEQSPAQGTFDLGTESPWVMPGVSLSGVGNVSRVEHRLTGTKVRSRVWVDLDANRGLKDSIKPIIAQAMGEIDYHALYLCTVVTQSGDLATVDLNPQGSRNQSLLGGLQRVPLRLAPGFKVQIAPGATVLLGWDGGSPTGPYACLGVPGDTALKVAISAAQVQVQATADASISGATAELTATGAVTVNGSTTKLGPVATFPVLTSPNAIDSMGVPVTLITPTTVLAG